MAKHLEEPKSVSPRRPMQKEPFSLQGLPKPLAASQPATPQVAAKPLSFANRPAKRLSLSRRKGSTAAQLANRPAAEAGDATKAVVNGLMADPNTFSEADLEPLPLSPEQSHSIATALTSGTAGVPSFSEFEEILARLVDRIAKILQAEKCVFLLHNPNKNELVAVAPALGIPTELLAKFQVKTRSHGLTAHVFKTGEPVILTRDEIAADPRAIADHLIDRFNVYDSVSVPLFIEHRDGENKIVSHETIGVAHVFNKTTAGEFGDEDKSLLASMSRNAASIFSSAQAFREVVHEKQELIQTLESLYVGLMMVALDGRIIQINPAARNVLGIDSDASVVGVRYEVIVENKHFTDLVGHSLSGLDPIEVTGEITTKTGVSERIYQAHCAPVKDHDDGGILGILILLNDITEIRGVDRMKTAFISTVSHELRTPLTSIKGFIATLLADTDGFYDLDTQREFYRIIDTECDRLTRLIDDLLNVSRIEQGRAMELNVEPVHLPTVVTKVLTAQRAYTLADRHRLEMNFPEDFPSIEADPDKVDQILTNLVNNAIKYSPQGGTVMVSGTHDADQDEIKMSISDNGMGIPREHIKKIFERFHRVDNRDNREIGGTGIGLFLVKTLVESHHGTIKVESEPGHGSVFTVTLPMQQPTAPAPLP